MPICSYLVVPEPGSLDRVTGALAELAACEVLPAENGELLVLLTDTESLQAEEDLRHQVEATDGIQALLLTFGEIDPDAPIDDPMTLGRARRSHPDGVPPGPARGGPR